MVEDERKVPNSIQSSSSAQDYNHECLWKNLEIHSKFCYDVFEADLKSICAHSIIVGNYSP